jgi:hypothetical protein
MEPQRPSGICLNWALPEQRTAFGRWMAELVLYTRQTYGLGLYDLPTWDYWQHFESGFSPKNAAELALGHDDD